jgi:hypothetical protein
MSGTPWLIENSDFDAIIAKPFLKKDLLDVMHKFTQGNHHSNGVGQVLNR